EEEQQKGAALQTDKLRKRVASLARKKMGPEWESIFRDDPVTITDNKGGTSHQLDLPIWRGADLVSAQMYGTILSARFRSATHRAASLSSGYVNFAQAAQFATRAKGGLFILRPAADEPGYGDALMHDIDNDI